MYDNKNKCAAFYVMFCLPENVTYYGDNMLHKYNMLSAWYAYFNKKESILIKHKIII